MLDGIMRRIIDPPLLEMGRALARRGVTADAVTLLGLACGVGCAAAIWLRLDLLALVLLGLGRFCDGLDGAIAEARRRTDRGGFLDIVCDFAFYGAVPLAFALRDPALNALPAAVLLASFYLNGATFLAYAALAAKRGLETTSRGHKSLYFTAGLAEGSETILVFVAMLLAPDWFCVLAYAFAPLVLATAISRSLIAWATFRD
ncbi:MAG: CDP-alcohol phosphatidyltransferase family protein [Bosea sp.]|jgi:phosphatidylglycerophosphate synthase|nr:CDP-alcohol phosphatidyltransferase family protein [Bosea sp. (in: a-proteobacteria)]